MCRVRWATVVMCRAALKAWVAWPMTCLPFSHLASLSSTLNHAQPCLSSSIIFTSHRAALSRSAIASFAATITFQHSS
ncbi:hypothetical protein EDB89DRAFT_1999473 [Lactarius sanguifluus]|nr:hypothetical protein EDB89DRAFT_1999473 [Lactarius sanguifluus]